MTARIRVLIAAMVAVLALSLAVGTASALRSLSIHGPQTLVLNGIARFSSEFAIITCNTTITKTISRVIPKITGILVGKVTRVDFPATKPEANCRSSVGRLTNIEVRGLEREEFSRILLAGILGTLPEITGILLLVSRFRASFTTEISGRCGYEAPAAGLPVLAALDAAGNIGDLVLERNAAVRLEGGIFCPRTGELNATLRPLQRNIVLLI